jgi:MscS family membrane protein
MLRWAKETESEFDDQLAPFASRTLKVVVIIVGVLVGLQNFGVNVTALLAGLGIGGVALAFAAQDTVANVFGTITIILDRPFKLGEHIKVGDTEGIIEEVGFRSTRIRTFYNSLVTIPNSVMAKERIDNLSLRNGWIRCRHTLGFTYDATMEQIKQFTEELRYLVMQDPRVDRNRAFINFNSYGESSINVLVNFHFQVKPDEVIMQIENEYLELIHATAEKHKLSFAFPTRTLVVTNPATPTDKAVTL